MKTRYTFLKYIWQTTFLGTLGVVGVSWIVASVLYFNSFPFITIVGIAYMYPAIIIGLATSLISVVSVSFLTFIFFRIPSPTSYIFQIMIIIVASVISFSLSFLMWGMILAWETVMPMFSPVNFVMLHAIPTTLILTFVHYRALPHMFGTVQKRKEK